jgi:hypothetical protein
MIGDHPVADAVVALGGYAARLDRSLDERLEKVGIVIVVDALQNGGEPL